MMLLHREILYKRLLHLRLCLLITAKYIGTETHSQLSLCLLSHICYCCLYLCCHCQVQTKVILT